jgi:predicted RNase H-like nuclease (RuvC/YqgF family)
MDTQKQILIVSLLIIALSGALAILFYSGSQEELSRIHSLRRENDIVASKKTEIFKDIEKLNQEREQLNIKLKDYSEKIQIYQSDLGLLKSEKDDVLNKLSEIEHFASSLEKKRAGIVEREQALEANLADAQKAHEELIERLEYARNEKSELEESLKSYMQTTKGVELPKIVVKVVKPAKGVIVEVSREYNFAVVDIGEDNGIKKGDYLEVYRDNSLIAKAIIENVYADMSSIVVFNQWRHVDLAVGDSVKLQSS